MSVSMSVSVTPSLTLSLSRCLSASHSLSASVSMSVSVTPSLTLSLPLSVSMSVSVTPSLTLSLFLCPCLSLCMSLSLSLCLSVTPHTLPHDHCMAMRLLSPDISHYALGVWPVNDQCLSSPDEINGPETSSPWLRTTLGTMLCDYRRGYRIFWRGGGGEGQGGPLRGGGWSPLSAKNYYLNTKDFQLQGWVITPVPPPTHTHTWIRHWIRVGDHPGLCYVIRVGVWLPNTRPWYVQPCLCDWVIKGLGMSSRVCVTG